MEFLPIAIDQYAVDHTTAHTILLASIERYTQAKVLMPRMLSGHLQGRFLAMISKMLQPKCIVELGTYTGYSALCLAEGLFPDGQIITIDKNEELEEAVQGFFQQSEFKNQIDYRIGNAIDLIPALPNEIDLVFIDADKINYLVYYQALISKVRKGGFLIADNVLWSGKVVDGSNDKDTIAIKAFNDFVHQDERVENILLPLRDGLLILRKR